MIIVLDTNVVVSSIFRPYGKSAAILRLVVSGLLTPAYDQRILSEYREVLNRPKFDLSEESINNFLAMRKQKYFPRRNSSSVR